MSQFGMQMPGARGKRHASPDVYTALAVLATAFLIAACVVMYLAGSAIGKGGSPIGIQEPGKIEFAAKR